MHAAALPRVEALCEGSDPWALPTPCIAEFLRVVTHPRVLNPPSTIAESAAFLRALIESPSCRIIGPGPTHTTRLLDEIRGSDARGNLVFDAQIVAMLREHGIGDILTNDRDFERFHGIRVHYL